MHCFWQCLGSTAWQLVALCFCLRMMLLFSEASSSYYTIGQLIDQILHWYSHIFCSPMQKAMELFGSYSLQDRSSCCLGIGWFSTFGIWGGTLYSKIWIRVGQVSIYQTTRRIESLPGRIYSLRDPSDENLHCNMETVWCSVVGGFFLHSGIKKDISRTRCSSWWFGGFIFNMYAWYECLLMRVGLSRGQACVRIWFHPQGWIHCPSERQDCDSVLGYCIFVLTCCCWQCLNGISQ